MHGRRKLRPCVSPIRRLAAQRHRPKPPRQKPEILEDSLDDGLLQDRGGELQLTAAVRSMFMSITKTRLSSRAQHIN